MVQYKHIRYKEKTVNPQDQPQQQPTQFDSPEFAQAASTVSAAMNGRPTPQSQPVQAQPQQKVLEVRFEDDLVLTVTPQKVNDMRFLELYEEVAESEFKIPKLLKFMFGEEAYEGIHKYYNDRGRVFEITKMGEVFQKLDSDLNSNPDFLRQ